MSKYAAFGAHLEAGTAQEETATVVGTITGSGDADVTITAAGMTGSPKTIQVAVLVDDTADTVARKMREELAGDADVTAMFSVHGSGALVVLRRLLAAANDGTLNIAYTNNTCTGLTPDASSDNTVAGVAQAEIAGVTNIGGPSLSLDQVDVTSHDSTGGWEEVIGTILRTGEVSFEIVYDPAGSTHDAATGLVYRLESKVLTFFDLIFFSTYNWTFFGYVNGFEPGAPVDQGLTASVKVKIAEAPTLE